MSPLLFQIALSIHFVISESITDPLCYLEKHFRCEGSPEATSLIFPRYFKCISRVGDASATPIDNEILNDKVNVAETAPTRENEWGIAQK